MPPEKELVEGLRHDIYSTYVPQKIFFKYSVICHVQRNVSCKAKNEDPCN